MKPPPPRDCDLVEFNCAWLPHRKHPREVNFTETPEQGQSEESILHNQSLLCIFKKVQNIRCYVWKIIWIAGESWASHLNCLGPISLSYLSNLEDLASKTCFGLCSVLFFKVKHKLFYDFWHIHILFHIDQQNIFLNQGPILCCKKYCRWLYSIA